MIKAQDYFSDLPTDMASLLQSMRQEFPLPEEYRIADNSYKTFGLLALLAETPIEKVANLRLRLRPDIAAELFESYARTEDTELYRKLDIVAETAAGLSLWIQGWYSFQRYYPLTALTRGFCKMLDVLVNRSDNSSVSEALFRLFASGLTSQSTAEDILYILLSALPEKKQQADGYYSIATDLADCLKTFRIELTSALGAELIAAYFTAEIESTNKKDSISFNEKRATQISPLIWENRKLILEALPHMLPASASVLLATIIRSTWFSQAKRRYFYQPFLVAWPPSDPANKAYYAALKPVELRAIQRRGCAYNLETQFSLNISKRSFFLDYFPFIKAADFITPTILAIDFTDFVVIDSFMDEEYSLVYAKSLLKDLINKGALAEKLAEPNIPYQDIEQVIERGEVNGLVRVQFNGKGLKAAHRLFEVITGGVKTRTNPDILGKWLK